MGYLRDEVSSQPDFLEKFTFINPFDFRKPLVDHNELTKTREGAKPVNAADVVKAKVYGLNLGEGLLVEAKLLAL